MKKLLLMTDGLKGKLVLLKEAKLTSILSSHFSLRVFHEMRLLFVSFFPPKLLSIESEENESIEKNWSHKNIH